MHPELQESSDSRVFRPAIIETARSNIGYRVEGPTEDVGQRDDVLGTPAVIESQGVDHVQLGTWRELAEVDDDVKSFGDSLNRQILVDPIAVHRAKRDGVLHDVAVVGDQVVIDTVIGNVQADRTRERATVSADLFHNGELEEACHGTVEDAEAVPAGTHLKVWLVQPVDGHPVAQKAIHIQAVSHV